MAVRMRDAALWCSLVLSIGGCSPRPEPQSATTHSSDTFYQTTKELISQVRTSGRISREFKAFVLETIELRGVSILNGLAALLVPCAQVPHEEDFNWIMDTLRWLQRTSRGGDRIAWTVAFGSAVSYRLREPFLSGEAISLKELRRMERVLERSIHKEGRLDAESLKLLSSLLDDRLVCVQNYAGLWLMRAKEGGIDREILVGLITPKPPAHHPLMEEYWDAIVRQLRN